MSATTRQLISIRASIVQIIIHRASRITGYRAAHVTLRELEKNQFPSPRRRDPRSFV